MGSVLVHSTRIIYKHWKLDIKVYQLKCWNLRVKLLFTVQCLFHNPTKFPSERSFLQSYYIVLGSGSGITKKWTKSESDKYMNLLEYLFCVYLEVLSTEVWYTGTAIRTANANISCNNYTIIKANGILCITQYLFWKN